MALVCGINIVSACLFLARISGFDKQFEDYLGSRPGERTQAAALFDKDAEQLPSLDEFCRYFAEWLERLHDTPRKGKIHQGATPAQVWGERPVKPPIPDARLRFAFLRPVGVRKVQRGPGVQWEKTIYIADELFDYFDKKVVVKLDQFDPTHVYCYTLDGRLICEAKTRDAIKAMALDDAGARERISAELARQRRQIKSVYTAVRTLTGDLHLVSPRELLLADADAKLETGKTVVSVKGASHRYTRHYLVRDEDEDFTVYDSDTFNEIYMEMRG